jgi:hypothetical protein
MEPNHKKKREPEPRPDRGSDVKEDRREEPAGGQQQRDRDLDMPRPGSKDMEEDE